MARLFDGISDAMTASSAFLSASSGPFVVGLWFKPANLSQSSSYVMHSGSLAGSFWAIRWESVSNALDFTASGGSSFATSSSITLDATDVSNGCRVAWRYRGAGSEWSKWKATDNGGLGTVTKTVINASLTATLPTLATAATILSSLTAPVNATIAEVWIAQCDASDEQMQEVLRGVTADQVFGRGGALKAYWPLRGNNAPDPDYAGLPLLSGGSSMAVTGVCEQATHPTTYGRDDLTGAGQQLHAWVLEVEHADETIYAASTDLYDQVDMDVLGRPYPGLMANGGDISVGRSIVDGIGTVTSPPTIILSTEVNTPAPLRPGLCTTYPTAVALDRPVSYWRMGDSATTLSGTTQTTLRDIGSAKLHASISGSVTLGATGALTGDNNKAMTLSGSSSNYASVIAGASALDLTSAVTVECWMKPAATTGSFGLVERTTASGTSNKQWALFTYYTGGVNYVYWRGIKSTTSYNATYTIGASMSTSAWMHIVGTYDGNNLKLYVNGVLRSTTAVGGALDTASNGIVFLGRLGDTSYVLNGSLDEVAIYDHALSVDQVYRHYRIGANGPREWRDVPCRLRRYERSSHELVTELSGVVVDSDWSIPGRVTLHIADQNDAVLDTLIPTRLVNSDEHPTAGDIGAPVPVVFGTAILSPPFIGYDDEADPGGWDFAVSHMKDAADTTMSIRFRRGWYDSEPGSPGLEMAAEWVDAIGTITYQDADDINIGGAHEDRYEVGMPVRFKTTTSGSAYVYSYITSIDSVNHRIRVADAVLDSGLNGLQTYAEVTVSTSLYDSHAKDVLSVRIAGDPGGSGVVVEAANASITNPASAIKEILTNSEWSIGETVNSGSFTTAVADYAAAGSGFYASGLSDACKYALGGDRQQRAVRTVLRELLSMRGAWLTRDDDGAWQICVDKARATPWRTFGYADGVYNNVKSLAYERQTPLAEATARINLRYGPTGRIASNGDGGAAFLATNDFIGSIYVDSMAVGVDRVVTNPWVRSYKNAAIVCKYAAKRAAAEDRQWGLVLGISGRNIQLGEILNLSCGHDGTDQQVRVVGYRKRQGETLAQVVGYSSTIFDDPTAGDITFENQTTTGSNTSSDAETVNQMTTTQGTGINYFRNGDFLLGPRSTAIASNSNTVLPGILVSNPGSIISALTATEDPATIGGAYLTLTTSALDAGFGMSVIPGSGGTTVGMPISQYEVGCFSFWCDSSTGWWVRVFVLDSGGGTEHTLAPAIRVDTAASHPKGWQRYYTLFRPTSADSAYALAYWYTRGSGTFKLDAVQMEKLVRGSTRPTNWKPAPAAGLILTKTETVTTPGTGASTVDTSSSNKLLEAGATIVDVTMIVTTAFNGAGTTLSLGPKSGTATLYANATARTANTRTSAVVNGNGFGTADKTIATANQLTLTSNGGNFGTTGAAKITVHYYLPFVPMA